MLIMEVQILRPGVSDHSSLTITLDKVSKTRSRAFKFFNRIADHPEFIQITALAWQGHLKEDLKTIWWKLKKVKTTLKDLNNIEFKGVKDKIQKIREQLHDVQTEMRDHNQVDANIENERELRKQLEK